MRPHVSVLVFLLVFFAFSSSSTFVSSSSSSSSSSSLASKLSSLRLDSLQYSEADSSASDLDALLEELTSQFSHIKANTKNNDQLFNIHHLVEPLRQRDSNSMRFNDNYEEEEENDDDKPLWKYVRQ